MAYVGASMKAEYVSLRLAPRASQIPSGQASSWIQPQGFHGKWSDVYCLVGFPLPTPVAGVLPAALPHFALRRAAKEVLNESRMCKGPGCQVLLMPRVHRAGGSRVSWRVSDFEF